MYKIDFKNGFSDCNDYVFPKKLKWFLMQLRLFNYIDLMKDYKESFFKSFTTNKLPGPFIYYYDGWDFNQFKFDDTDDIKRSKYPGWCWDNFMIYYIKYIIRPTISNYLNNSKFNNGFYHNYAKKYYDKLASSIKNNIDESGSLENTIVPFETAFNEFLKTNSFEETINELFKIIIYKSNRSVVEFKSTNTNGVNKKCNVSIYDLFFRPLSALKKISKHINCENEAEHPFSFQFDKTIFDQFHPSFKIQYDDIKYKEFLNCINTEKITEVDFKKIDSVTNYTVFYTVLKQIIRYVFVHQFKQSFGIYLNRLRTKDSNIDLIISNTDSFYKDYISSLEDNIKFYDDSIVTCKKMRQNSKNIIEKIQPIFNTVQQYWCNVVSHDIEHSDNYYTINSFMESSVQKIHDKSFGFSDIGELINTILYLKKYDSKMIEKTQNYSFVDKWNEIINKKELVNKEDENISRYSFEIA